MFVTFLFTKINYHCIGLEGPPHEREVVGSIPSCDRPKSLKLVVVAFPLGVKEYGNSLRLAHQSQDNGLVKYWLKNSPGSMDL